MAYDQNTRNRLQRFVSEARNLLSGEFARQFQQKYGLDASSGEVSGLGRLVHLNDREMETAQMLRDTLAHYLASSPSGGKRECLERMIREQAFTVLNRLCALRMAEAREIIIESLSRTYNSKGFQLYARLAGTALGETGDAYRTYIFSLFDELSLDLPVLFDRFSPQGYLFPGEGVLLELLGMMNDSDLSPLWVEDETIGWIYQYFNSLDERRQMRSESQAPRNSRELAVRNQFFTPRYVVEFLTDNTLGRLWYEMTRGETQLKDSCSYLVRRPQEIFLAAGEEAPEPEESTDDLSQEEMLQQALYIPYRPLKDPREILMLDPACGSMHFGLYAFDLYEKIYEEAWDLESQLGFRVFERSENLQPLQQTYASKEEFLRDVPRLIVECNIHGVDIDSRAVQIAGLSLWLRAQRSWLCQGLKPQQRPQIRKSNVVCAEPMPGEKGMLEEFAGKLKPRVLGQLVEMIFDKMQLAGEAGSLLKIEEEIEEALNLAREEFQKEIQIRNVERSTLFPDINPPRQASLFDFTDLGDKTRFWNFAEQKLLDALREYAEQAEDTDAVQKRLFAQDAARGFAFIDLFRKRYDVVLMNPPFGESAKDTKIYFNSAYPLTKNDIFGVFVERFLGNLSTDGYLGCISNKTGLFLQTFVNWRRLIINEPNMLDVVVDLGFGVLDNAVVETAMYTIRTGNEIQNCYTPFIRACNCIDKGPMVEKCVEAINTSILNQYNWFRRLDEFKRIPFQPLCYWAPKTIVDAFYICDSFAPKHGYIYQGIATGDNFRFLKCRWEVPSTLLGEIWKTYIKGGTSRPFYSDNYLVVMWSDSGLEVKAYAKQNYGSASRTIKNEITFELPGITYTQVTVKGFFPRVMPAGSIYDMKGPMIQNEEDDYYFVLGVLCSLPVKVFSKMITDSRQWHPTNMMKIPFPIADHQQKSIISSLTKIAVERQKNLFAKDEMSSCFVSPSIFNSNTESVDHIQIQLDKAVAELYGIPLEELTMTHQLFEEVHSFELEDNEEDDPLEYSSENNNWLSYIVGCIYGRWDIRYAMGEKDPLEQPDPFATLPVCSPGMLQNHEGLPASAQDVPEGYPLRVIWSGILVDDEGQNEDIIARVRETIEAIWKEKAGDIEQEACEMLGVDSLRDYFRKPGNFFAEHLKRYSKSRRQAPIYWPLSTASGSYTIWLYYQRLNDQTLYRCVNDYVEPKLKRVMDSTHQLRQKTGRNRQEERELEELVNLEQELQEFRDELLRVAAFWKPDLNDGVQITAAPLWKLFRLPKWRTTLKETWEKLEKGDYDWAHLAYSIWPERVREKCKHDKSLTIAHDLEDIYEEPVAQVKKKGGRGKKNT